MTDTHGQRTKGTLRDLVSSSLIVTVGGETRDFSETNITKVERRDSIENGIWIGLAAGVGTTVVACKVDPDPEHCPYLVAHVGLPAIGAGIILGGFIDLLFRRTLYLAPDSNVSSRLKLSPVVSRTRTGVLMSVTF